MRTKPAPTGLRRRASIDLGALTRNILALSQGSQLTVDGRAGAYGIGLDALERAAVEAGAGVSTTGEADLGIEVYGFTRGETVLTVSAEVVSTKRVTAGTGVSYGYTYSTETDTNLALVCLGFADGIPRRASNLASVSVGGNRYPAVGRIAMDQFVINIGNDTVALGDEVIVFGDPGKGHPPISEWADAAALEPQQLTARLGSRITREVIGG